MTKLSVRHAPLAQLDRASGYGPEGREFESLRAYQKNLEALLRGSFVLSGQSVTPQWIAAILRGFGPVVAFWAETDSFPLWKSIPIIATRAIVAPL